MLSPSQQSEIYSLGNTEILNHHKTAFLCSRNYPASAVLPIYDWAKAMRESGECVLSSFHSLLERDVLEILIKGKQPIILAAAHGLLKRYPTEIKKAIDNGRLLIVTPFPAAISRITATTASKRNTFMLSLADRIVVGHISEGSALADAVQEIPASKEIIYLTD